MNYFNLDLSVLDSEEFVGSDPVQRSTWLCLMRYCIGQENSGRIIAARHWPDRKWQQLTKVTKDEALSECDLWRWDGDDVVVMFYPHQKEAEVKQKREAGRLGGQSKSEAKSKASRANGLAAAKAETKHEPSIAQAQPKHDDIGEPKHNPSTSQAETQRKEKEKEKEKESIEEGKPSSCSERKESAPEPVANGGITWSPKGFDGIGESDMEGWREAYPAVDLKVQIARAHQWLLDNPAKRKKAVRRFLTNWFARTQERGGDIPSNPSRPVAPDHHLGFRPSNRVKASELETQEIL